VSDPNTAWWADPKALDPQWLEIDLGTQQTIGAVTILWWKAYAKDYTIQISDDGKNWREVAKGGKPS
jgi:hypothetical protein